MVRGGVALSPEREPAHGDGPPSFLGRGNMVPMRSRKRSPRCGRVVLRDALAQFSPPPKKRISDILFFGGKP